MRIPRCRRVIGAKVTAAESPPQKVAGPESRLRRESQPQRVTAAKSPPRRATGPEPPAQRATSAGYGQDGSGTPRPVRTPASARSPPPITPPRSQVALGPSATQWSSDVRVQVEA